MKTYTRFIGLILLSSNCFGQQVIQPGTSHTFASPADGAAIGCQTGPVEAPCLPPVFDFTEANVATREVNARTSVNDPPAPEPQYARAKVWHNFKVGGPDENFVAAQVSTSYDWIGGLFYSAAYQAGASLSLSIRNVDSGEIVASKSLIEQQGTGDQGLTDIAIGSDRQRLFGAAAHFSVLLKRNTNYRLIFESEALSRGFGTEVRSRAFAKLTDLTISVDEDEVAQLWEHHDLVEAAILEHEAAIQADIANHDQDIKTGLAQHDEDIKALLEQMSGGQMEIIRLLLTPQGRRSSDWCDSGDCSFPENP